MIRVMGWMMDITIMKVIEKKKNRLTDSLKMDRVIDSLKMDRVIDSLKMDRLIDSLKISI
jgi:hypothetical protein